MRDDNRHGGCLEHSARNASPESAPARSDDQQPRPAPCCDFDELIDRVAVDDLAVRHDAPPGGYRQGGVECALPAEERPNRSPLR
ncbi:MAG TPA: hypothetical protein VJ247_07095, partial [Gaiella sp.]|nr:hypothetical protein [Gaiella sp.]